MTLAGGIALVNCANRGLGWTYVEDLMATGAAKVYVARLSACDSFGSSWD